MRVEDNNNNLAPSFPNSSSSPTKKIQITLDPSDLNDPILFSNFTQQDPPITLPCGHSYAKSSFDHIKYQGKCPQCKKRFQIAQVYDKNIFMTDILSKIENSKRYICDVCKNNNALFICLEEGSLLCTVCICKDKTHSSHEKDDIEEYILETRKKVRELEDMHLGFSDCEDEKILFEGLDTIVKALKSDIKFHLMANKIWIQKWKNQSKKIMEEHEKFLKGQKKLNLITKQIDEHMQKGSQLKAQQFQKIDKINAYFEQARLEIKKKVHDLLNNVKNDEGSQHFTKSGVKSNENFKPIKEGIDMIRSIHKSLSSNQMGGVFSSQKHDQYSSSDFQHKYEVYIDDDFNRQGTESNKLYPENVKQLLQQGIGFLQQCNYTLALQFFERCLREDSQNISAIVNKTAVLIVLERHQEALDFINNLRVSDNIQITLCKAILYNKVGETEMAIQYSNDIVQNFEKDQENSKVPQSCIAKSYYQLALGYKNLNQLRKSELNCQKGHYIDPSDAQLLNLQGEIQCQVGEYEASLKSYNQALIADPLYINSYIGKAEVLILQHKQPMALEELDKALQIDPNYPKALLRKAKLVEQMDQQAKQISSLDFNIQTQPNKIKSYSQKGCFMLEIGRYRDAITYFDQSLRIEKEGYDALLQKGIALLKLKKYKDSSACFDRVIEKSQEDLKGKGHYWKGIYYQHKGQYKKSIENLLKAGKHKTLNLECFYNLAYGYHKLKLDEKAIEFIKYAQVLNGLDPRVAYLKECINEKKSL